MPADKFVYQPDELLLTQCVSCRHRHTDGPGCTAFPDGIPEVIRQNGYDHRKPYLGPDGQPLDTGTDGTESITFEPDDDLDPKALTLLYQELDRQPPNAP